MKKTFQYLFAWATFIPLFISLTWVSYELLTNNSLELDLTSPPSGLRTYKQPALSIIALMIWIENGLLIVILYLWGKNLGED